MEIKKLAETLEDIKRVRDDSSEFWYAKELFSLLGYSSWRNFEAAIDRAIESCKASGEMVKVHFARVRKTQKSSNQYGETEIQVDDYELTRYACLLIAQNGNPRIPQIAFAQMYFAIQTRKQELFEHQIEEIERLIARRQLAETDREFAVEYSYALMNL